jgi:hypothetical protein
MPVPGQDLRTAALHAFRERSQRSARRQLHFPAVAFAEVSGERTQAAHRPALERDQVKATAAGRLLDSPAQGTCAEPRRPASSRRAFTAAETSPSKIPTCLGTRGSPTPIALIIICSSIVDFLTRKDRSVAPFRTGGQTDIPTFGYPPRPPHRARRAATERLASSRDRYDRSLPPIFRPAHLGPAQRLIWRARSQLIETEHSRAIKSATSSSSIAIESATRSALPDGTPRLNTHHGRGNQVADFVLRQAGSPKRGSPRSFLACSPPCTVGAGDAGTR